jgi:hypothetical protein
MLQPSRIVSWFGIVLVGGLTVSLFSGCGEATPKPTTEQARVTGSVSFDGKALPLDSSVVFFCSDHGATAAGTIDSLGKFQLAATIAGIGIPVGRYKVMVRPPAPPAADVNNQQAYAEMMRAGGTAKKDAETAPSNIPKPFLSLSTTTLTLELKPGDNNFDIDLAKLAK